MATINNIFGNGLCLRQSKVLHFSRFFRQSCFPFTSTTFLATTANIFALTAHSVFIAFVIGLSTLYSAVSFAFTTTDTISTEAGYRGADDMITILDGRIFMSGQFPYDTFQPTFYQSFPGIQMLGAASAEGRYAIAIGPGAEAKGTFAIAIGKESITSLGGMTFGVENTVDGAHSVAVGEENSITGQDIVAIGYRNSASGDGSIAAGTNNNATGGKDSIAIGYSNEGTGTNSTAVGYNNNATANNSIAVGYDNNATGVNSTAVGYDNNATGTDSVAIGRSSTATGDYSSAIGYDNLSSEVESTALGVSNNSPSHRASALGVLNTSSAIAASAVGFDNTAAGQDSSAFGYRNNLSSNAVYSAAVGYRNTVNNEYSYAFGGGLTINEISSTTDRQSVVGTYNVVDDSAIFILGSGRADNDRRNAFKVVRDSNQVVFSVAPDNSSDKRLKKNIRAFDQYGLQEILALNPVRFIWKRENMEDVGLIAQEVYQVIPEIVSQGGGDENLDWDELSGEEKWSMSYSKVGLVLINAIKEQQAIIENLKQDNQKKIDALEKRLTQLETRLNQ